MAFRQIKTPAIANAAVTNVKLAGTAISLKLLYLVLI